LWHECEWEDSLLVLVIGVVLQLDVDYNSLIIDFIGITIVAVYGYNSEIILCKYDAREVHLVIDTLIEVFKF